LSLGPLDLSVLWDKPKDPTFPYDPKRHSYSDWEDGAETISSITMIGLVRGANFMSIADFQDEIKSIPSTGVKFESISYFGIEGLKLLYPLRAF